MSRFGKIATGALLVLPIALGGCTPRKGTANPEDYFPLIQVALAGGETASMIGRNEAIKAKNFAGCVAAASLISAFDSSNQVLAGRLEDKIVIPAVDVDVSECLALREAPAAEENASLAPVTYSTQVAGYAYAAPAEGDGEAPAESSETPAESAPEASDGDGEAAEKEAPEEAPAPAPEPAPAEENSADVEAAVAEAEANLKGHPDAAVLVEAIAGITIAAVTHYATKLQKTNCKKGTAALGAINYVAGMIQPVTEEIADPDGKLSVPAVTIDLSQCAEG